MQFIEDTAGHVHTAAYVIPIGCTLATCKHCGKKISPNAAGRWVPVMVEPSDFYRRDAGDYIVKHPDRKDDSMWVACVWKFGPSQWRHDSMGMYAPHFKTMRDAIADRCAA